MNLNINYEKDISPDERIKLLALSRVEGVGSKRILKFLRHYKSLTPLERLKQTELGRSFPQRSAEIINSGTYIKGIKDYLTELKVRDINWFTLFDSNYPTLLKEIHDPPVVIFVSGDFKKDDFHRCISVVGTRSCSSYGKRVTRYIVKKLVKCGFTIVSGMAFGIDKISHQTAVENNGRTIAVLAADVSRSSPRSNYSTFENIKNSGFVISEYDHKVEVHKGMFSARNRIVSGLSLGTVIIEAPEKSGALITANLALNQGREVFAVPGEIVTDTSVGTNKLIKKGEAKLVQNVDDIIEEFGLVDINNKSQNNVSLDKVEKLILEKLARKGLGVDELSKIIDLPISKISQKVVNLEIKGVIRRAAGNKYNIVY